MRKRPIRFLVILAQIAWFAPASSALQPARTVVLPMNGRVVRVPPFVTMKNQPVREPTRAELKWEKDGLRVRFDCTDSAIAAQQRSRDFAEIWRDDSVEVFIDRDHTHLESSAWKHFIINAAGSIWDESGPAVGYFSSGASAGGDRLFNSKIEARTARTATGWMAEILVPWRDLGGAPRAGDVWGFNLARTNHPIDEYSCFAPTFGGFYNMTQWGHLIFDDGRRNRLANAESMIRSRHREVLSMHDKDVDEKECRAPMPALGKTWVEIKGQVYGAKPDERGPIGGGAGYKAIITQGDYTVTTLPELLDALKQARPGQVVFVPADAQIDCTVRVHIEQLALEIPAGVTLAGDRGHDGSNGALIYSDAFATQPLIKVLGPDVRITGLRLRGPDPEKRLDLHELSSASGKARNVPGGFDRDYYYKFPTSDGIATEYSGLQVDNCELAGWSHSAISLKKGERHHIHHNYIHHNQRNGLGYGISHGYDKSESLIEYNVFNHNRHSIAATGVSGNAYEARHNVEVENSLSHCFDMHGGRDRGDGSQIAGTWMKVYNNTFNSVSKPVAIRGVPEQEATIYRNWFPHHRPDRGGQLAPVVTDGNTHVYDNAYGLKTPQLLDAPK